MAETKKKIVRKPIDESLFVKTWTTVYKSGGTIHDVAQRLGCTYSGALIKAKKLTEAGVKLPKLAGGGRSMRDVGALNELIKQELDG